MIPMWALVEQNSVLGSLIHVEMDFEILLVIWSFSCREMYVINVVGVLHPTTVDLDLRIYVLTSQF